MRLIPYLMTLGIVLTVVFVVSGTATVSAQNSAQQYGGGSVSGYVFGYNMWDELIPIGWAQIKASNDLYTFTYSSYSDGSYFFFLPSGTFNLTVTEPGFQTQSKSIAISNGSATSGYNFFLERSNVPIPEFPTELFALLMVIAITGALFAKRTIKRKNP